MTPSESRPPAPPATPVRRAVVDIGTNSVKVLVADVDPAGVAPVWETSRQTRLGRGFYQDHRLQPEPVAATAAAVADFVRQARELGAAPPRIIATSAARDAVNAEDLHQAVRAACGLGIEVLSGDQEAEWGFRGVTTNPRLAGRRLLVLDVGGGSSEFIVGTRTPEMRQSSPLGSVRLLERMPPGDPPSPADLGRVRAHLDGFLEREVAPQLDPALERGGRPELAVGIGGSTAILAHVRHRSPGFDREQIEATRFSGADLTALTERLWSLDLAARRELPGLPPERADVILFGAAIYDAILRRFRLPQLAISTRGLRFAALLEPVTVDAPGCR